MLHSCYYGFVLLASNCTLSRASNAQRMIPIIHPLNRLGMFLGNPNSHPPQSPPSCTIPPPNPKLNTKRVSSSPISSEYCTDVSFRMLSRRGGTRLRRG
ncbi:hypothetical protein GYMLUDRAFT_781095 [Collybiopsis luxurians FD-317 M1]|uniref:Uncharacterized protein n=1 Tax=Collybiopsis luxurians FD-317 M1 TaxID=944289 RepID=A0A0D0B0S7_9AGAR|nr:hypothetical protein GYMLUDRAFT_781095 [Collybiopsis luxurians FD-317 M1]